MLYPPLSYTWQNFTFELQSNAGGMKMLREEWGIPLTIPEVESWQDQFASEVSLTLCFEAS